MKYLNQFLKFHWGEFMRGKRLTATGVRELLEYQTKAKLGWVVDCVITEDKTVYKQKPGDTATNLYSPIAIKLEGMTVRPDVHVGDTVEVEGEPVCVVYGDFKDKLSVKASGMRVVAAPAGKDKV